MICDVDEEDKLNALMGQLLLEMEGQQVEGYPFHFLMDMLGVAEDRESWMRRHHHKLTRAGIWSFSYCSVCVSCMPLLRVFVI